MNVSEEDETGGAAIKAGLKKLSLGSDFGLCMCAHYISSMAPSLLPSVIPWLSSLGKGERTRVNTQWERGCPEVLPGLSTPGMIVTAETDRSCLPPALAFIAELEAGFIEVRREFLSLRGAASFQEYRSPSSSSSHGVNHCAESDVASMGELGTDAGAWRVCYLQLHNAGKDEGVGDALNKCPFTQSLLSRIPRSYGHAFFSVLHPGTHVQKHCGPTNKKVRVHLPLVIPAGDVARLRVGGRTVTLQEGRCLAFQDSWEHEAWLDSAAVSSRATLIVDIWHPLLTAEEVKALSFIRASSMRGAKAASNADALPESQDFYKILQVQEKVDDDEVFFGCPVVDD